MKGLPLVSMIGVLASSVDALGANRFMFHPALMDSFLEGNRAVAKGNPERFEWPAIKSGLKMDMKEIEDAYVAKIDVPGIPKEEVHLSVKNGIVTLSADHTEQKSGENEKYHWKERSCGHISRSFRLPEDVDEKDISAKQDHGVLELVMPKKKPSSPIEHKITIE
uniref:SHSP domain-containing protein n=1 Tax=Mucochytrium quahogii TaxID=96639 RepID=A0A7S2S8Y0_9STRA|mmetsp:Transcript_26124/g.56930  ORF Transcript_26124/g.56930 Transcript_26124/m.56930 type:complete len:165 (+) Transcript_26124:83-577(+)